MGTDSDKTKLFINGVDYTDCITTIAEHRLKASALAVGSVKLDGSASLYGNLFLQNLEGMKITFSVKKLRRKRLVKLLMAGGHSRNAANCIAKSWGWNYGKNYLRYSITGELF